MSTCLVTVNRITEILPIAKADKLELARVLDWYCIIQKGSYKVNDLIIYVPPDSILPASLIEKFNLTFLKKNNRVGVLKLRGAVSYGLILDNYLNFKEGEEVSAVLGITKYEQQDVYEASPMSGIRQTSKKKLNPNFFKYCDIENAKNYPDLFTTEDEIVVTEKIHGCLPSYSKIQCSDGVIRSLGDIVKNKLNVSVLGYDIINKKIVSTKIVNWFNNGLSKDWLKIKYSRNKLNRGNSYGTIELTPNHKFWCVNKQQYISASQLSIGDEVLTSRTDIKPSYIQEQMLIGKMLGDASRHSGVGSIAYSHKLEHKEYIEYCNSILGYLFSSTDYNKSGYGTQMIRSRTINNNFIEELFLKWFLTDKKEIPDTIKLSPISLAFWYMDDGSCSLGDFQQPVITIATCGFNEHSIDNLINALSCLGIEGIKYYDGAYFRIRVNAEEAHKFFLLIYPYIPQIMQYKLPTYYRHDKTVVLLTANNKHNQSLVSNKIISIEPHKANLTRYDIETSTHNYIADGVLVHNSNARYGWLKRKQSNWFDMIWAKIFGEYEFVYGSRNVQISSNLNYKGFYGEDVYGKAAKKLNLQTCLKQYPDYEFFGEVYGPKIQDLHYGAKEVGVIFFDIKDTNTGRYLDYDEFTEVMRKLFLPSVPVFYRGKFDKDLMLQYAVGASAIAHGNNLKQIREGVVVKTTKEKPSVIGRTLAKFINPEYLTRESGTELK